MIPRRSTTRLTRPASAHRRHRLAVRAFTLIEVTIAMGILATGILLLVALMPTGLETLHESSKKSMGRRISQNIISDMLLHDWNDLHEFDSGIVGVRYFDDYGIELTASQKTEATFRARVRVVPRNVVLDHSSPPAATNTYSLADDSGTLSNGTVTNLRRVHIDITSAPIPLFDTPDNFGPADGDVTDSRVRTYSAIISNMMDIDSILHP